MPTAFRWGLVSLLAVLALPLGALQLTSPDFTAGGALPVTYTCDGTRQSPPLAWSGAPQGTKAFAITMHHVPGPGDRHVYWVEYGLPATQTAVAAGTHTGGAWGLNTVNNLAEYTPPCSHGPGVKEYTFTVYALSVDPVFTKSPTMAELLTAIEGKTLATATLSVTYERTGTETVEASSQPSPPAQGDAGGPPKADLLHVPVALLVSELKLTTAQAADVRKALDTLRGREAEEAIAKVFTTAQSALLPELMTFLSALQTLGIPPEALEKLRFTAEQKKKLATATRETVDSVLTADQKTTIAEAKAQGPGPKAP